MASLIEQKEAERERSDALALAVLVDAGDEGARTAEVEARAGLNPKTAGRALARLKDAGLATREGERGRWFISPAGRIQAGAGVAALDLSPALTAAVELLPSEAHKAFVRLLISAVVARHHLLEHHPDGWGGFVALGPTQTAKTTLAHFVCDVFGLDHVRAVRLVQSETPASLLGQRTTETGGRRTFEPSPLLDEPFLCLDELDKARAGELKAAALKLLQGDAAQELEGDRFGIRPTVMVCFNARPDQLTAMVGEAYVRRSAVLDTTPLAPLLLEVATVVRRIRRPGTVPSIDLRAYVPPAAELAEELWQQLHALLGRELTAEGRALADVEAISRWVLGRAPFVGGDLELATLATAFDYLTTAATVGHAREGYAQRLRAELGADALLLPDTGAVAAEGDQRARAARDGRQRNLDEQLQLSAAHEQLRAVIDAGRKPLLRQTDPEARAVAQALKRALDELAVRKSAAGLEEVLESAKPWLERGARWVQQHEAERARAGQEAEQRRRDAAQQREYERQAKAAQRSAARTDRHQAGERRKAIAARKRALQSAYNRVQTRAGDDVVGHLVELGVIFRHQEAYSYTPPPPMAKNAWRQFTGQPKVQPAPQTRYRTVFEDVAGRRYGLADLGQYGTPAVRAAIEAAATAERIGLDPPKRSVAGRRPQLRSMN